METLSYNNPIQYASNGVHMDMWVATAIHRRCFASVYEAEVLCNCRWGARIEYEGGVRFELAGDLRGNVPYPSSSRNCDSVARLGGTFYNGVPPPGAWLLLLRAAFLGYGPGAIIAGCVLSSILPLVVSQSLGVGSKLLL